VAYDACSINAAPNFIYLRNQGFSVSAGSPYDIVYYGNRYYIYHNGLWYRSYYYRGPWVLGLNTGIFIIAGLTVTVTSFSAVMSTIEKCRINRTKLPSSAVSSFSKTKRLS
jgi:hypothetical protein